MGLPVVPLCALLSVIAGGDALRQTNRKQRADALMVEDNAKFFDPVWITIGDSYASGLGIHTSHSAYEDGDTQFGCYRDWTNVPGAKYARSAGMGFLNKACAFTYLNAVRSQLDELEREFPLDTQNKWNGSIVELRTGGNDLRTVRGETWEVLMTRCILNTENCSTDPQNQVTNWASVESDLASLFIRVAQFASGAMIRVSGYPRLMGFNGWCFAVPGMTGADAAWIDARVDQLADTVKSAVTRAKMVYPGVDIQFVDLTNYVTRGACSWSNRQINGVVLSLPEGLSYATLHPQQSGYDGMLAAMTASLPPLREPR